MSDADKQRFQEIFLREGRRHVAAMNTALLAAEKLPDHAEPLRQLFQSLHTLKGIADAEGHTHVTQLCHAMEDVVDAVRTQCLSFGVCVDLLLQSCDTLEASLKAIHEGHNEVFTESQVAQLKALAGTASMTHDSRPTTNDHEDTPTEVVDKLQRIDVSVDNLDALMNLAEELLVSKMKFDGLKETIDAPELVEAVDGLGRLVDELQFRVTQARMVPIGVIFNRFPRMVRDLAKQQHKAVDLVMTGREIELDRAVIDEIGESLVHLLRNAVDHGLEAAEARTHAGKTPTGTLSVTATRSKEFAVIEVRDDGAGLDTDEIKRTAMEHGTLVEDASPRAVMDAIFSGISTTKEVTNVSGRGLGLNIVKRKVESLGGSVRVESHPNTGTTFVIEIPLTMAIIQAIFARVGDRTYAIPLANVERMLSVTDNNIKGTLEFEAVVFEEEDVPICRLQSLFGTTPTAQGEHTLMIVVREGERIGLLVDELVMTQEIVVKPLNRVIRDNHYFSGTAIVGSGEPIMVLDIANIPLSRRETTLAAH